MLKILKKLKIATSRTFKIFTSRTIAISICSTAILILASSLFPGTAVAQLKVNTGLSRVKIDTFYHGDVININGDKDTGSDLILKIVSPETESALREKKKVGPFWMNQGELQLKNVPNLYLLYSTKDVNDILDQTKLNEIVSGYPAVEKHVKIEPVEGEIEKSAWFKEFIKLKEESGLYHISESRISTSHEGGREHFSIQIDWPFQAPPGRYSVNIYEVKNRNIIKGLHESFIVEKDGFVKAVGDMANKNGAVYGVLSIFIALAVGFGISMVFKNS
jgi:uncharacterized protein (TIGR02186 family)